MESRGKIISSPVFYTALLSLISLSSTSGVSSPARKPTLKLWHRPPSELNKSYQKTFLSCHVHIKCFTEKSLWMTDKLQWVLQHYVGPNNVRTIYDSDNQSALIPTTERCSLHYFLMSQNTIWREVYVYMYEKIFEFTIRKTFQTALIHVLEGSPLNIHIETEAGEFQLIDGHYFFLDGPSGWLYFRNLRGDWNAWETSRDIEGLMGSKMG
jgi:hypothetical protein